MPHNPQHIMAMQDCIKKCETCHDVCLETLHYCLKKGGKHANADHIGILRDCAAICTSSADFMVTGSPFHPQTCGLCFELCNACEKSCLEFKGDQQMKHCADVCRSCAEACQKMSGKTAQAA